MLFISAIFCALFLAYPIMSQGVHTLHDVTSKNGEWDIRAVISSPHEDNAFFTGSDLKNVGQILDFFVDPNSPAKYGFGFGEGVDFNVAYVITAIQRSTSSKFLQFQKENKVCVFVVTAKGPANPDVRIEKYNGALCSWAVVPGVGENFEVA